MARAFTDRDREIIRQRLIDKGREAFSRFGLKKTSVADLARGAGISKGSFYAFYDSKEELYLEIIETEEESFRARANTDSLKAFLLESLKIMETDPLIRAITKGDEFAQALRGVAPERLDRHVRADEEWMRGVVEGWRRKGLIADVDPGAVAGMIKLIVVSTLYKDSLGGANYDQALRLLIDLAATGLAPENYVRAGKDG